MEECCCVNQAFPLGIIGILGCWLPGIINTVIIVVVVTSGGTGVEWLITILSGDLLCSTRHSGYLDTSVTFLASLQLLVPKPFFQVPVIFPYGF